MYRKRIWQKNSINDLKFRLYIDSIINFYLDHLVLYSGLIDGAVKIVYPMGLPHYDPIKMELG